MAPRGLAGLLLQMQVVRHGVACITFRENNKLDKLAIQMNAKAIKIGLKGEKIEIIIKNLPYTPCRLIFLVATAVMHVVAEVTETNESVRTSG
jgi:hypothetical protein